MKRKKLLVTLFSLMLLLSGCTFSKNAYDDKKKTSIDDILIEVVQNKRSFVTEQKQTAYLNNYSSYGSLNVEKYTLIDIDDDGENELLLLTDSTYLDYLLFNYEKEIIYSYEITLRNITSIKSDGTNTWSSGSDVFGIARLYFDEGTYHFKELATRNGNEYFIDEKKVSSSEFQSYYVDYLNKEYAKWEIDNIEWMEKILLDFYKFEKIESYKVDTPSLTFVFMPNFQIENLEKDLLQSNNKIYYVDSNGKENQIYIYESGEVLENNDTMISKETAGVYDVNSHYIAVLIPHIDKIKAYYFKFEEDKIVYKKVKEITSMNEVFSTKDH